MATLTITAANVGTGVGANVQPFIVGQATNHGKVLYVDAADSKAKPTTVTAAATAKAVGLNVTYGSGDNASVLVIISGPLYLGAILTAGVEYYADSSGNISTKDELASGEFITRLGIAISTTVLQVKIDATGVAV
jgi:hypothetical protein